MVHNIYFLENPRGFFLLCGGRDIQKELYESRRESRFRCLYSVNTLIIVHIIAVRYIVERKSLEKNIICAKKKKKKLRIH